MKELQIIYLMDLATCSTVVRTSSFILVFGVSFAAVSLLLSWEECCMTELRKRTLLFSALFTIFIGVSVAIFLPSERAIQAMILTGYADNNSTISDSDKEVIRKTIENKTK